MGVLCWDLVLWFVSLCPVFLSILLLRKRDLVALHFNCCLHGTMSYDWSVVCDYGISWSYSFTHLLSKIKQQEADVFRLTIVCCSKSAVSIFFYPENVIRLLHLLHYKLYSNALQTDFIMDTNTMNPDQTAPEQSDLGS